MNCDRISSASRCWVISRSDQIWARLTGFDRLTLEPQDTLSLAVRSGDIGTSRPLNASGMDIFERLRIVNVPVQVLVDRTPLGVATMVGFAEHGGERTIGEFDSPVGVGNSDAFR